ncbi:MAG: hypothetical protein ACYTFG_08945 [Planctomycetota bacterium]
MSQNFPQVEGPIGPEDYGRASETNVRPGGLTVIAILAWVFGGMAFCCLPFSIVQVFFPISAGPQGNPMAGVYEQMPWIKFFTLASALFGMLLSVVLAVGGFGIWKLRRWGWPVLNGYSVVQLLSVLVQTGVNFAVIFPESSKAFADIPGGEGMAPMMYASGACGMIISSLLPIAILIVINTGSAARAKPPA